MDMVSTTRSMDLVKKAAKHVCRNNAQQRTFWPVPDDKLCGDVSKLQLTSASCTYIQVEA